MEAAKNSRTCMSWAGYRGDDEALRISRNYLSFPSTLRARSQSPCLGGQNGFSSTRHWHSGRLFARAVVADRQRGNLGLLEPGCLDGRDDASMSCDILSLDTPMTYVHLLPSGKTIAKLIGDLCIVFLPPPTTTDQILQARGLESWS